MRDNPLTINETKLLCQALDILEKQFYKEAGAVASIVDSDSEEYIDIQIDYANGTQSSMAVERTRLTDGSKAKDIASAIC